MEANTVAHPSDYILKALDSGKLDDTGAQAVLAHLEVCQACRDRAVKLSGEGALKRLHAAHPANATMPNAANLVDTGATAISHAHQAADSQATTPYEMSSVPSELRAHPQYEVLRELGRGGMGVVYLAKHKLSGRVEVLKVMNKALIEQADSRERFLREIQSAARLDHKNVVKMYTALECGELMVLVMEYVPGEDLAKLVKSSGALPVSNACYYIQQAASGLQHAYEKGMIHRDIKPQNMILAREGKKHTVKVLDFGLAKAARGDDAETGLTNRGAMMGTPGYIPPEQSLDAANVDIRADIYSLGCSLYHLLAGNQPFSGRSVFEIVQAHHSQEAKPLNVVRPEVSAELAAVVRKMMAKDAAQRYQKPMEVVRALDPFIKGALKPLSPQATPPKPGEPDASPPEIRETAIKGHATVAKGGAKPLPATKGGPRVASRSQLLCQETLLEGRAALAGPTKPADAPRSRKGLFAALAVVLMLVGLAGLCAVLVLRVKTADGILVIEINEPGADVYVDGEKMTVSWADSGQTAEIRVRPGTRMIKVKKDGFSDFSEKVKLQAGKQRALTAWLVPSTRVENRNAQAPLDRNSTSESKLIPVTGKVTLYGTPLPAGQVAFHPEMDKGNKAGGTPAGAIGPDGTYKLSTNGKNGAPAGKYKVTVVTNFPGVQGIPVEIDKKYADPNLSGLKLEVVPNAAAGAYDLKLTK